MWVLRIVRIWSRHLLPTVRKGDHQRKYRLCRDNLYAMRLPGSCEYGQFDRWEQGGKFTYVRTHCSPIPACLTPGFDVCYSWCWRWYLLLGFKMSDKAENLQVHGLHVLAGSSLVKLSRWTRSVYLHTSRNGDIEASNSTTLRFNISRFATHESIKSIRAEIEDQHLGALGSSTNHLPKGKAWPSTWLQIIESPHIPNPVTMTGPKAPMRRITCGRPCWTVSLAERNYQRRIYWS